MSEVQLGDMTVIGEWPGKLLKALAVIADRLHPVFDEQPWTRPGKSKDSCVLVSLAVRDFLIEIGFTDARVRSVTCMMRADDRDGKELHSLGIGAPPAAYGNRQRIDEPGRWDGHLVVTVPSAGGALIDATLGSSIRPQWGGLLTGMFALPYVKPLRRVQVHGCSSIAAARRYGKDGREFTIIWLDRPGNSGWKVAPDTEPWRRAVVTAALVAKFGPWSESPA